MNGLPFSLALYKGATAALESLAPALLSRRARRGKEDSARIGERLGRSGLDRPAGPLVWLHGASVGEGLSILPLVEALHAARPGLAMLVTTGTVTSAELLARRLPAAARHQFVPVDAPRAAAAFLDHWRPDLGVLVESELWPNLILSAQARGVPLALVSARLSRSSLSGWGRSPASARRLLSAFSLVMAQDDATASALSALGARDDGRMNLKLLGTPLPVDEAMLAQVRRTAAGRPILVAASTHPGEEEPVLEAFSHLAGLPQRPLLTLVPRHPARGAEVAALARDMGLLVNRQGAGERFDGMAQVYVADALGELGLWFRAAASVLVGGGWAPGVGGHNPLEPARLGAPFASGPDVANWTGIYADLAAAEAVEIVTGAPSLAGVFAADLTDPTAAAARAERARAVAERGAASLDVAASKLLALLP